MKTTLIAIASTLAVLVAALILAIALGGPSRPAPLASVNDPFKSVDFSGLPAIENYRARDGGSLAYRRYASATAPLGSVVLIHGSSGRSNSVHALARGLAQAGYAVFALDMRGHGASGIKGRIDYIGQLEHDVEDFVQAVQPTGPRVLMGFSAGGGFALRFAGGEKQNLFDRYVLLSPFLSQDAITYRPHSGGWVNVGVPRIAGLVALNKLGITQFNHLSVTSFALNDVARRELTPEYSFSLALNFRPRWDYQQNMRDARQPLQVLVGADDDEFLADRFDPAFRDAGRPVPVTVVPGTGHIGMTTDAAGIAAVVAALRR